MELDLVNMDGTVLAQSSISPKLAYQKELRLATIFFKLALIHMNSSR